MTWNALQTRIHIGQNLGYIEARYARLRIEAEHHAADPEPQESA